MLEFKPTVKNTMTITTHANSLSGQAALSLRVESQTDMKRLLADVE